MLFLKLLDWLAGYGTVTFSSSDGNAAGIMEILIGEGMHYSCLRRENRETVSFNLRRKDCKKLLSLLDKNTSEVYYSIKDHGLPALCRRYRLRPGIPIGALLFAVLLWFGSRVLWSVELCGEGVDAAVLREVLEENGCRAGAYIPNIDCYALCADLRATMPDIAWLSVNILGTTAYVEYHREAPRGTVESTVAPSNLVASSSGVIDSFVVYSGQIVVKRDENVVKGQLLVSGAVDSQVIGYRLVRSYGRVIAEVTRTITVEEPCETVLHVLTGNEQKFHTVTFFGHTLHLPGSRIQPPASWMYEEDTETAALRFPGGRALPLTWDTVTRAEYVEEPWVRSDEETQTAAELAMSERMAEELGGAEILSRKTEAGFYEADDGGRRYRITCEVVCMMNIAEEVPLGTRP